MTLDSTAQIAATAATVLLSAVGIVQILCIIGLPFGALVWGGRHRVLPRGARIASALALLVYAGLALILLARAGLVGAGGQGVLVMAAWAVVGYFVLGTAMNALSRSRPERLVMTPVCGALAACSFLVALPA